MQAAPPVLVREVPAAPQRLTSNLKRDSKADIPLERFRKLSTELNAKFKSATLGAAPIRKEAEEEDPLFDAMKLKSMRKASLRKISAHGPSIGIKRIGANTDHRVRMSESESTSGSSILRASMDPSAKVRTASNS
jgi:hypothetical protein